MRYISYLFISARYLVHLVKDGDASPGDGLTVKFRVLIYLCSVLLKNSIHQGHLFFNTSLMLILCIPFHLHK